MRSNIALLLVVAVLGCTPPGRAVDKIGFALDSLDADGLYGPADGKRALSYEFCIPDNEWVLEEIRHLDPSAEAQPSRGRIGCTEGQLLVIGSTHQPGHRQVLMRLARRPDIERIEPAHFE